MKKYLFMALFGWSLFTLRAHAQWVVSDPMNFAGNIANTVKEIATAGKALKKVNNLIGDAYKVKECVLMVGEISEIYVKSYKRMLQDKNFRPSELAAIASGYTKLLEQSGESLKELKSVAGSNVFSMNDSERMQMIDRIYTTLREYRSLVSYYTQKNISVSYVRARAKGDLSAVRSLYGSDVSRYW